jgi:hypothetical protein
VATVRMPAFNRERVQSAWRTVYVDIASPWVGLRPYRHTTSGTHCSYYWACRIGVRTGNPLSRERLMDRSRHDGRLQVRGQRAKIPCGSAQRLKPKAPSPARDGVVRVPLGSHAPSAHVSPLVNYPPWAPGSRHSSQRLRRAVGFGN